MPGPSPTDCVTSPNLGTFGCARTAASVTLCRADARTARRARRAVRTIRRSETQALLERRQLVAHRGGQVVAHLREPLLDQRDLGLPLLDVDLERGLDVGDVGVEPLEVDLVGGGQDRKSVV